MDKQILQDKLEEIRKQALGTYSGAIIKLVHMLCRLIEELHPDQDPTIVEKADAHILLPDLSQELTSSPAPDSVPESELSESGDKTKGNTKKTSTNKDEEATAKLQPGRIPMSDEGKKDVISSATEAAAVIKKEKAKKKETLENIFSDNKSGRYSGPTDA